MKIESNITPFRSASPDTAGRSHHLTGATSHRGKSDSVSSPLKKAETCMVLSISTQFEAGKDPKSVQEDPSYRHLVPVEYQDLPIITKTWFEHRYLDGIISLLDLWDEFGIEVTSHMSAAGVLENPELAQEIARRGHEVSLFGMNWKDEYNVQRDEEKRILANSIRTIEHITGRTPRGHKCSWLRRTDNTLSVLQELGIEYHVGDVPSDEAYIEMVDGKPFVMIPYLVTSSDRSFAKECYYSTRQFFNRLKDEFDQIYHASNDDAKMMSISIHDSISGAPGMITALRKFLTYTKSHNGLHFVRKDQLAQATLQMPQDRVGRKMS